MFFAIPGLQRPSETPKDDNRIYTDVYGSLSLEIDSGLEVNSRYSKYEVYISVENDLLSWENVFEDKVGQYVFERPATHSKSYWFEILYKDLLIEQGHYKITVLKDRKLHKEYSLNLEASAVYQQESELDAYIREMECQGLSVYNGQFKYLQGTLNIFQHLTNYVSDISVIRHSKRCLQYYGQNTLAKVVTTCDRMIGKWALKSSNNVIEVSEESNLNKIAALKSMTSTVFLDTHSGITARRGMSSNELITVASLSDLRQRNRWMFSYTSTRINHIRSILDVNTLRDPDYYKYTQMESEDVVI